MKFTNAAQNALEGFVLVNKPAGITSHDVVGFVRRTFKMRRVGHAGTLDPMATGVLIILLGKSTRLFDKFAAFDKAYRATLRLGLKTTTADITGKTLLERPFAGIDEQAVRQVFTKFTGEIEQRPPMVSAVKHQGQRLYKIALQGLQVERAARRVRIEELRILQYRPPEVEFLMKCSKGTYVRQLAEDAGEVLGCGACISQIERTQVGPFEIKDAVTLENLNENYILKWRP
jgi:tRNA pseudouridine55 synthase